MNDNPEVIISGFGDEAAIHKTAVEQFSAMAALGLQYYSLRFIDVGRGVKNVMQLSTAEIQKVRHLEDEYDLSVASIGSPIGKVKLLDVDDGTKNAYVPFAKYLAKDVARVCQLAHAFETKLIRGFSFYHPRGTDPWPHVPQAVDQIGQIVEACHRSDLTFGLEVEANLVGQNGLILSEIHRQVNHPALVLVFDAGNLITQGFTQREVFEHYQAMKPGIGWMHIKDYRHPGRRKKGVRTVFPSPATRSTSRSKKKGSDSLVVDEAALRHFVPADLGDSAHDTILRDFRESIPARRSASSGAAFPASSWNSSPMSREADNSAVPAGPMAWGSP